MLKGRKTPFPPPPPLFLSLPIFYVSFMSSLTPHLPTSIWTEQNSPLVVVKMYSVYKSIKNTILFFCNYEASVIYIVILLLDIYKLLRLNVKANGGGGHI